MGQADAVPVTGGMDGRDETISPDADEPLQPDSLATNSDLLDEIALILSAGDSADGETIDSLRRVGCQVCGQVGRAVCTSPSTAAGPCPLDAYRRAAI